MRARIAWRDGATEDAVARPARDARAPHADPARADPRCSASACAPTGWSSRWPRPGDDAHAYYALSKSLYIEGSFGGPSFDDASDWSPGAPLLYAATFYATAGAREGTARIVELLLGLAAIVVAYLLGRRIACRPRA